MCSLKFPLRYCIKYTVLISLINIIGDSIFLKLILMFRDCFPYSLVKPIQNKKRRRGFKPVICQDFRDGTEFSSSRSIFTVYIILIILYIILYYYANPSEVPIKELKIVWNVTAGNTVCVPISLLKWKEVLFFFFSEDFGFLIPMNGWGELHPDINRYRISLNISAHNIYYFNHQGKIGHKNFCWQGFSKIFITFCSQWGLGLCGVVIYLVTCNSMSRPAEGLVPQSIIAILISFT
jgi:hypothetical protein